MTTPSPWAARAIQEKRASQKPSRSCDAIFSLRRRSANDVSLSAKEAHILALRTLSLSSDYQESHCVPSPLCTTPRCRGPASSPTGKQQRRQGGLVWRGRPNQTQQRKGREERGALHLRATGTAQRQRLSPPRACTDGFPQAASGEMPHSAPLTRMTSFSARCAAFSTSSHQRSSTSSGRSCCSWASTQRTSSRGSSC